MHTLNRPLFIKWDERSETGVPLIDVQHKGIVSIINTFYYMMGRKVNNYMLYSCISDTLKNYSNIHFITEETFLVECQYDDIDQHKTLHRKLAVEIDLIEREGIKTNDPRPLLEFLKKWWLEHINEQDMQYAQKITFPRRNSP